MKGPGNKISSYNENKNWNVEEALGILKTKSLIPLGFRISHKAKTLTGRDLKA